LIPTRDFQRALLAARGTPPGPAALYLLLRDTIAREASEYGVPTLIVDGSRDVDATVASVEELFADALAERPRAETLGERRSLLREANEAIASQVRAYYARPWAEGDGASVVREFICECGDSSCDASVQVPVGALSFEPLLARGHRSRPGARDLRRTPQRQGPAATGSIT
jgi:hypothetical protein